jgi:cystathionine beta-lyase/cystathionine gamma-synthase
MLAPLLRYRKDFGGILSSKAAWSILVYGLPTLALRIKRQQYTAKRVAAWLEKQDLVRRVVYPGLASFPQRELAERQMRDFDGDFAPGQHDLVRARSREDRRRGIRRRDREQRVLRDARREPRTHEDADRAAGPHDAFSYAEGATAGSAIRMSIGLESPSDIQADLKAAMQACARVGA